MHRLNRLIPLGLLLMAFASTAQALPDSFADLAAEQADSVVNISTTTVVRGSQQGLPPGFGFPPGSPFEDFFKDFFRNMPPQERHALGTGFIISSDGYIVTNNHVIDGADEIVVKMRDGKEYEAEIVGVDPKLDVGLIKVKARGLKAVRIGDSDKLRVGDWVVAIGNPFGLEQTVTAGIVSAKGRVIGSGPYDDFIQTDAAINPGNSGGPLFNVKGEVVGINTAIYSRSGGNNGIGFAIPINLAFSILDDLKKTGHVTRARLGVHITDIDKATQEALGLKSREGALVPQVEAGSAADKAGIRAGDVIVSLDGVRIRKAHDLPIRVARHKPGDKVKVGIIRDGKP
ncbi:MAG: Do family serine endopeptidase, partial [Alphaproteobacteria bacterium]